MMDCGAKSDWHCNREWTGVGAPDSAGAFAEGGGTGAGRRREARVAPGAGGMEE